MTAAATPRITEAVGGRQSEGHLQDDLLWVIATNPDPTLPWPMSLDRRRGVVCGWRQWADLAPLVEAVAAAVAWGAWQPPGRHLQLPADPTSRAWAKAARRAKFLRQERRGALAEVHVIDLEKTAAGTPRPARRADPDRPQYNSPIAHDRIGHWRRARVGPRASWHYEYRWIPPVRVRGRDPGEPERLVVHRLPHHRKPGSRRPHSRSGRRPHRPPNNRSPFKHRGHGRGPVTIRSTGRTSVTPRAISIIPRWLRTRTRCRSRRHRNPPARIHHRSVRQVSSVHMHTTAAVHWTAAPA